MAECTIECLAQGEYYVIRTHGYLDAVGGEKMSLAVRSGLSEGKQFFLLNLVGSPVINSQGVTSIFEVVEQIVDVHQGRIFFVGLNRTTRNVFRMVGLLMMGQEFETEQEVFQGAEAQPTA